MAALALTFAACAASQTPPSEAVDVTGIVENLCEGCVTADLINGGSLEWDVIAIRLATPESLSGTTISARILIEGDGAAQRSIYRQSSRIVFSAATSALEEKKVMLHAADVKAVQ